MTTANLTKEIWEAAPVGAEFYVHFTASDPKGHSWTFTKLSDTKARYTHNVANVHNTQLIDSLLVNPEFCYVVEKSFNPSDLDDEALWE